MDKLGTHTSDIVKENYRKLTTLFPDAAAGTKDEEGNVVCAISKNVLVQETNAQVMDDGQEHYRFTWPDKRKSVILANAPIAKTLRFEKERSARRDGTPGGTDFENIYIEGDNPDALKLLQETYLNKVRMVYVGPPRNTDSDFVYRGSFNIDADEYKDNGRRTDEDRNQLVQDLGSNGRFYTDWLNMLYPRIKIIEDFLSEEGLTFISIDDSGQQNLRKICDEIFGEGSFVVTFIQEKRKTRGNRKAISIRRDYIVCCSRNCSGRNQALGLKEMNGDAIGRYKDPDNDPRGPQTSVPTTAQSRHGTGSQSYISESPPGKKSDPPSGSCWRVTWPRMQEAIVGDRVWFREDGNNIPRIEKFITEGKQGLTPESILVTDFVGTNDSTKRDPVSLFDGLAVSKTPKPAGLIQHFIGITTKAEDGILLDFFSGTAASAQVLFEQNVRGNIKRKFTLVQPPEETDEKSRAYKADYRTICDIGEGRIRWVGKKIKKETGVDIDYGFRYSKVDPSDTKDIYYRPTELGQASLDDYTDNIKGDRILEDLLIQVMLSPGVLPSSKAEQTEIGGEKVFSVADGYLISCFDKDVVEGVVTEIAKRHPFYFVSRGSSMASDSVATNFGEIFKTYSPEAVGKVL